MKFFKDFKRGLAIAQARQAVRGRYVNFNFTMLRVFDIPIFTDNELLLAACGVYPQEVGALANVTSFAADTKLEIYVTDAFHEIPKWAQEAIVMHEIGHWKLEHRPTPRQLLGRQLGLLSCLQMEKEADLYSATRGYQMERVLKEILFQQNREVKARIQALQDWEYLGQVFMS